MEKMKEVENMEKKKSLIRRILDYKFPWNRNFARKMERQDSLMIALFKVLKSGDEEEFWKVWREHR